jgi:hypothetical protein
VADAQPLPALEGNPLLQAYEQVGGSSGAEGADRDALIACYGFSVPTDEALRLVARFAPEGVRLLHTLELPHWQGMQDDLHVYVRLDA